MVPRKDVHILEMSVEDGLKLLLSGGIVVSVPSYQNKAKDFGGQDIPVYRRHTSYHG